MKRVAGSTPQAWEKIGGPTVLAKKFGLSLELQSFRHPTTGEPEEFSSFSKKDGLTVCAITVAGNVLVIEEFAQAADRVVYKLPAGVAKTPAEAAAEVREETGYEPAEVVETSSGLFLLAPRKSPSGFRTYVATGCRQVGAQQLDAGEAAIAVYEASTDEVWRLIAEGKLQAIESVTALFMAALRGYLPFPAVQ